MIKYIFTKNQILQRNFKTILSIPKRTFCEHNKLKEEDKLAQSISLDQGKTINCK
jgi:hypothetical protein